MTDHESIINSFKGKDVFAYVCIIETTNNNYHTYLCINGKQKHVSI